MSNFATGGMKSMGIRTPWLKRVKTAAIARRRTKSPSNSDSAVDVSLSSIAVDDAKRFPGIDNTDSNVIKFYLRTLVNSPPVSQVKCAVMSSNQNQYPVLKDADVPVNNYTAMGAGGAGVTIGYKRRQCTCMGVWCLIGGSFLRLRTFRMYVCNVIYF